MNRQKNAVHVMKRGLELPRAVIECTLPLMNQQEVKLLQSALTAYRLNDHCKQSDKLGLTIYSMLSGYVQQIHEI